MPEQRERVATSRGERAAPIDEDAEEQSAELLALLLPGERTERADQRLLHGLLRVGAIGEQVGGVATQPARVPIHEHAKGLNVALADSVDYLGV
jgi:hypothetical protein